MHKRSKSAMRLRHRRSSVARKVGSWLFVVFLFARVEVLAQIQSGTSELSSGSGTFQTSFEVRFLEFDNVYLSVGPGSVLAKGMKLLVRHPSSHWKDGPVIAELKVKIVSPTSVICEVLRSEENVQPGDMAVLTPEELSSVMKQRSLAVVTANGNGSGGAKLSAQPRPSTAADRANEPKTTIIDASATGQQSSNGKSAAALTEITTQPTIAAAVQTTTRASAASQQSTNLQTKTVFTSPPGKVAKTTQANVLPQPSLTAVSSQPQAVSVAVQPQQIAAIPASVPPPQLKSANTAAPVTQATSLPVPSADTANPTTGSTSQDQDHAQNAIGGSLPDMQTIFKIKFVAQDTVYLSAGTATGLTAGLKLIVKHSEADITEKGTLAKASQAPTIAELEVISVASSSAVCEVRSKKSDIQPGDLAFMDQATAEAFAEKRALSATRKYPQVVSFTEGDPLEEEVRNDVPRPPLPEVGRLRGRIGFDYSSIRSAGSVVANNSAMGMVVRADFTRIGGSYWNLSGYWRGRLNHTSYVEQPTLQDLINRTYHLDLTYSSPTSPWVAGFGRLYLPWASSLDTIDGGYVGRKEGKRVLLGVFAGSTPDPTSWDYNPDRRIGGLFLNLEGGSFNSLRVSSTSGIALSTLLWKVDRPFIFFEQGLYYKRYLSIYDSMQADDPRPIAGLTAPGPGLSRNFFTMRFQPHERISFDVNHNYFRDVPTFNTALIATGLLDKYLFQGLSAGARVEPIRHITFYTSVGKSSRTGDTSSSWNEMYGVTLSRIWRTGLRADVRASKFNSSFGDGRYRSVSLSRNFTDVLRLEVQVGEQSLASQLTSQTKSRFVNATLDGNLGRNYFVQGAYTVERGGTFNYDQLTVTLGYRFDNRTRGVGK